MQTVLEHNTWDDVVLEESDRLAAERLVASSTFASVAVATECTARATDHWDVHYAANPRNYKDRRYLHNEFPQLLEPRRGGLQDQELLVLEIGCGAGNSLLPLLHTNPTARGFACDLACDRVTTLHTAYTLHTQSCRFAFMHTASMACPQLASSC